MTGCVLTLSGLLFAQAPPQPLPPTVRPAAQQQPTPADDGQPKPDPTVTTPYPEQFARIDAQTVSVRRLTESWQLWAGPTLLKDFGKSQADAEDARKAVRDLRPTEWAGIGSPRPVVEYGLTNDRPATWAPHPKWSLPVDLKSVRAKAVRGAWVLADDANILLNFGPARADAEQAAAVCRKYGFNRLGLIGSPAPAMTYFYAAPPAAAPNRGGDPLAGLARAAQEADLARTGIPVPGVGFVGERVVIDPRRTDVRKDRGEFVLAHGPDILGRFGQDEWAARDARRVVQDGRFTEFCTVGPAGPTFFLVNGRAPARVPFAAQGTRFSPKDLKSRLVGDHWGVYDGAGRLLFPVAGRDEAETLVKLLQAFQFDQLCQVGATPRTCLKFLAATGGR